MNDAAPSIPPFDPSATHHQRPKLRPIRGFPVQHNGQTLLGLSDARQVSDQVVYTLPQAQAILPHMTGEVDLDGIAGSVGKGLTREMLEGLVAQLDHAGLLEGPTFEAMLTEMRAEYDSAAYLPPASTAQFADAIVGDQIAREIGEASGGQVTREQVGERLASMSDDDKRDRGTQGLRDLMDQWIKQAMDEEDTPSFDSLPRAVIAPHLDYPRGWLNYAHVYGRMRVVDRPDRIIILGTNHFGMSTGVCGCDKGFASPFGVCPFDEEFASLVRNALGEAQAETLFSERYDHEREHSIELHIPWIQHVFGQDDAGNFPKVFGALVHDPVVANGESYDGNGLGIQPFIDAMKSAIASSPGRTLIVSSADLSHIGRSFGDQRPIVGDDPEAEAFRNEVVQHDQEMLKLIQEGKPEELVASMAWMQNKTRWCSIGNLVATLKITEAESVDVLKYLASGDQGGMALVTSCAACIK